MGDEIVKQESAPAITDEQIEAWRRGRVEQCAAAIQEATERFNCQLVAVARVADGRIVADVQLVAK